MIRMIYTNYYCVSTFNERQVHPLKEINKDTLCICIDAPSTYLIIVLIVCLKYVFFLNICYI